MVSPFWYTSSSFYKFLKAKDNFSEGKPLCFSIQILPHLQSFVVVFQLLFSSRVFWKPSRSKHAMTIALMCFFVHVSFSLLWQRLTAIDYAADYFIGFWPPMWRFLSVTLNYCLSLQNGKNSNHKWFLDFQNIQHAKLWKHNSSYVDSIFCLGSLQNIVF